MKVNSGQCLFAKFYSFYKNGTKQQQQQKAAQSLKQQKLNPEH